MVVKYRYVQAAAVWLTASLAACSSAPSSSSNTNAAANKAAGGSTSTTTTPGASPGNAADQTTTGSAPEVTQVDASATAQAPAQGATAPTANGWCAAAGATSVVKSTGMASAFALLCNNGQATQLLADTMVTSAYTGSGSPNLQMIHPIADANGTVTALFGVGIKLPISSKVEFDKVAPDQGSVAYASQLIVNQGDTPGNITSQVETSNPDKGWVRGWTMNNPSTKAVSFVKISTEYSTQVDQYDLGGGFYLYTSKILKSVSTMKDYELITASFDINGTGYLLTVAQIAADDHGFASIATQTVTKVASVLVDFMYQKAAAAK